MTLRETLRAIVGRPTRIEIVLNFCFWIVLATGHAASAPKGYFPEAQTDTSGWVVTR